MKTKRVQASQVVELHWDLHEAPLLQGSTYYFTEIQANRLGYLRSIEAMVQVTDLTNVDALYEFTSFMGTVSPQLADGSGPMAKARPDLASFGFNELGAELHKAIVNELRRVARELQASLAS